jgi:hypothetical protein
MSEVLDIGSGLEMLIDFNRYGVPLEGPFVHSPCPSTNFSKALP